ncbi:hypothetical protein [Paenibacillus rubinfantis]|uniref:hypothetical protein n=1 Tax=Paenibacillus rubinfantis TaxID=1720296 RepID=UPI00073F8E2E|nr:hypothetical protein [Paenibacillus rubinfantis]
MSDDLFKNALSGINDQVRATERMIHEVSRSIEEKNRRKEEREIRLLEATEQTAKNTAVLPEMLGLIQQGNDKQDEIFEIIVEILSISKSKSKAEAESKYRKIMKKATEFKGNVETITKLINYATTVWNTVEKLF